MSEKKAILILEDNLAVLRPWVEAVRAALRDVCVRGSDSIEDAWAAIHEVEGDGYELAVVIADIVKGRGPDEDREWGIGFLEDVKKRYPAAFRIVFSGQLERPEIQDLLDKGLIHDFEDKGPRIDQKVVETLTEKIKQMLQGINVGNVQSPSAEHEFSLFLEHWIKSLPQGEDTEMKSLGGRIFTAGELREDPQLQADFRKAFEALRLDEMVDVSARRKPAE